MIRPAGEHARLIEVAGDQTPADVAAALRCTWPAELVDVVPGHETVLAVWAGLPPAAHEIEAAASTPPASAADVRTEPVVIPVVYDGPDLAAVAAAVGLSIEGLITRHTAIDYRVGFIGFLPGFAYLVSDDHTLHVPRHADPRPSVPAGSVALGGEYCSVYPRASPGGWQLLGTTAETLFDADRSPPALLEAGMQVRFTAVRG